MTAIAKIHQSLIVIDCISFGVINGDIKETLIGVVTIFHFVISPGLVEIMWFPLVYFSGVFPWQPDRT